jgi:hypothetical protein
MIKKTYLRNNNQIFWLPGQSPFIFLLCNHPFTSSGGCRTVLYLTGDGNRQVDMDKDGHGAYSLGFAGHTQGRRISSTHRSLYGDLSWVLTTSAKVVDD